MVVRFTLVFAAGRIQCTGQIVEADGRLYHLELPRAAGLLDSVPGTVEGREVSIPAVDVLGAIRNLYGGAGWAASGARARLTGATPFPHSLEEGRQVLGAVDAMIAGGQLLGEVEPPRYLDEGRRRLRWLAVSAEPQGSQVEARFEEREQAEVWLQRRAFARTVGWFFVRADELFDNPAENPTLDELLDVADYLGEPPSSMLARAKQDA